MKIVVGTERKRKIDTVKRVAQQLTKGLEIVVIGAVAKSEMPETPYDRQTYDGAVNRAKHARVLIADADYHVGLESGLIERYEHIYEEAWCVIIDRANKEYAGYSSGLRLPDFVIKKMDNMKMEHSDVMTILEKEYGKLPADT